MFDFKCLVDYRLYIVGNYNTHKQTNIYVNLSYINALLAQKFLTFE